MLSRGRKMVDLALKHVHVNRNVDMSTAVVPQKEKRGAGLNVHTVDQNRINEAVFDQDIVPGIVPDQNIVVSDIVPDKDIVPYIVPDQDIVPDKDIVVSDNFPDMDIVPDIFPDMDIVTDIVPDKDIVVSDIVPDIVPDLNFVTDIVLDRDIFPGQNIVPYKGITSTPMDSDDCIDSTVVDIIDINDISDITVPEGASIHDIIILEDVRDVEFMPMEALEQAAYGTIDDAQADVGELNHNELVPNDQQLKPKKRLRSNDERKTHYLETHPLLEACKDSCRRKCSNKITEEHRKQINVVFWTLSFDGRRGWLDSNITISAVKRRKVRTIDNAKKGQTLIYSLPIDDGLNQQVCKTMFLHTLGLKTDGMITSFTAAKKTREGALSPTADRRGEREPINKINQDTIRQHINSYHPQVSHYTREHAPKRRYLDSYLSITDMWRDFKDSHFILSYETYRKVFEGEMITFGQPPQDECDQCTAFKIHEKEAGDDHDRQSCETCIRMAKHSARAKEARIAYQTPVDENICTFAADMQKVILLPKMTIKNHFFVSRLVVFNETFANMSSNKPDYTILWHEGISGRLASDVASAYIKCIVSCGSKNIIFWVDNCSGQNKNWTLFTALVSCVNSEWGPDMVRIKYLEKGHTFMAADNVHGSIGIKMRKAPEILTFDDFVDLADKSAKNIKPVVMQISDFYAFKAGNKSRNSKTFTMPLLCDIVEVEFRKFSKSLFFKEGSFNNPTKEATFLKRHFVAEMSLKHTTPRGLPVSKKQGIVNLLQPCVPPAKMKFWLDIPETNVPDLTDNATSNDDSIHDL